MSPGLAILASRSPDFLCPLNFVRKFFLAFPGASFSQKTCPLDFVREAFLAFPGAALVFFMSPGLAILGESFAGLPLPTELCKKVFSRLPWRGDWCSLIPPASPSLASRSPDFLCPLDLVRKAFLAFPGAAFVFFIAPGLAILASRSPDFLCPLGKGFRLTPLGDAGRGVFLGVRGRRGCRSG
ncbi:MAG: hypothetical protein ABW078_14765, partial [Sedimenticola sp.]